MANADPEFEIDSGEKDGCGNPRAVVTFCFVVPFPGQISHEDKGTSILSVVYLLGMKSIVFVGAASCRDGEQVAAGSRSYNKARSYPKA
jgi:hypothetical protein